MSKHNDGGPAFPISEWHLKTGPNGRATHPDWRGMTLRDYFAAKALVGLIASQDCAGRPAMVTKDAYRIADAMLAARGENDGR
jgi:hypothetical protein